MLMLPDRNGVVCDTRCIFWVGVFIRGEQPSAVAMPESQLRIVGVLLVVAMSVVS